MGDVVVEGMEEVEWWTGQVLDVVCGEVRGVLHKAAFYCPGIRQACIELKGGELVTPKMFTILGNKAALKNWKTAIRSRGVSLRRLMEVGYLDFHDHASSCTGRCVTRSGTSKYDNMHSLLAATAAVMYCGGGEGDGEGFTDLSRDDVIIPQPQLPSGEGDGIFYSVAGRKSSASGNLDRDRSDYQPISYKLSDGGVGLFTNSNSKLSPKIEPGVAMVTTLSPPLTTTTTLTVSMDLDNDFNIPDMSRMTDDSSEFWRSITQIGLLDDFIKEIKSAVDNLKTDLLRNRFPAEVSTKLSTLVTELDLDTRLKYKLMAHKHETERLHSLVDEEVDALRQRLTKTQQCQQELKRRSDCFELLLDIGRNTKCVTHNTC